MRSFLDWIEDSRYRTRSAVLEQGLMRIKKQLAEEVKQIMQSPERAPRPSEMSAEKGTRACFLDHLKY